jgi:MFS transporter, MCT family, solute carrier family 16 (monocarboxylic acid transporters), member 10
MGIGVGLLFLPALTVLGHHFRRHRALAMGIASTGASMGGIIFPIMLNRLQPLLGFQKTVRISAGIAGVLLLVANVLMRTKSMVKSKETQGNIPRPAIAKIFSDLAYTTSIFA